MKIDRSHAIAIHIGPDADLDSCVEGQDASIYVSGDGSIDYYIDAFRAALVAAGFSTVVAGRLQLAEDGE